MRRPFSPMTPTPLGLFDPTPRHLCPTLRLRSFCPRTPIPRSSARRQPEHTDGIAVRCVAGAEHTYARRTISGATTPRIPLDQ